MYRPSITRLRFVGVTCRREASAPCDALLVLVAFFPFFLIVFTSAILLRDIIREIAMMCYVVLNWSERVHVNVPIHFFRERCIALHRRIRRPTRPAVPAR
jgi:hypothetical protein